ncbi:MAG: hypothetical protein ACOYIK_02220 [Coriobacteriales bacterium]|jgi:hypothetical protein
MNWKPEKDLTDMPLEKIRFESEDLFVLLNGMDLGQFAVPPAALATIVDKPELLKKWRKQMIRHLKPFGLVDSEGVPSPKLERALYPLNKPGILLTDGVKVAPEEVWSENDHRTYEICISDGHATAIGRASGYKAGWAMVSFVEDEERWEPMFGLLSGFATAWKYSVYEQAFSMDDAEGLKLMHAVEGNDPAFVDKTAKELGIDPEPLLDVTSKIGEAGFEETRMDNYCTYDFSESEFKEYEGFGTCEPSDPAPEKFTRVYPAYGFMISTERSLAPGMKPGDMRTPEGKAKSQFKHFDFMRSGRVLDRMITIDPNPLGL